MNLYKRFMRLRQRRSRGRHFGFRFIRAEGFAVPERIRLGGGVVEIAVPNDHGAVTAFVDVLLDDCYRVHSLPDAVTTIADIGAHVGLFSLAARDRWPAARIHCYEPNPSVSELLASHAIAANVEAFSEAVGLTEGTVSLQADSESVQVRTIEGALDGEITQISFAAVLKRLGGSIDLVKLDCEGAEWKILQDEASWRCVKYLTMEYHLWAGYSISQLLGVIDRLGFDVITSEQAGIDFGLLLAKNRTPVPSCI